MNGKSVLTISLEDISVLLDAFLPDYDFYVRNPCKVAIDLIGSYLVSTDHEGVTAIRIVEVEAYGGEDDPASHAFRGLTKRNAPMWDSPGRSYVYFTYGMHYCFNVVTSPKGVAGAVLVRAGQPIQGVDIMTRRRGRSFLGDLCSGPAKLCQAMGIDSILNNVILDTPRLCILIPRNRKQIEIERSARIGIRNGLNLPWRFYEKDSVWISAKTLNPA